MSSTTRVVVYNAGAIHENSFSAPAKQKEWSQKIHHALRTFEENGANIVFICEVSIKHREILLKDLKPQRWGASATSEFIILHSPEYEIMQQEKRRVFPDKDTAKYSWRMYQQVPLSGS